LRLRLRLLGRIRAEIDVHLLADDQRALFTARIDGRHTVPPGSKLEDHYSVGDWVRARILRIEEDEKKVGLSMRGVAQPTAAEIAELERAAAEARGGGHAEAADDHAGDEKAG